MTDQKQYHSLMDIVDEAYVIVNDRIDEIRQRYCKGPLDELIKEVHRDVTEVSFLKDLRALLNLSENFRDE